MADEMDRFFNLLQEQGRTLTAQGNTLAAIAQSMEDTHERLFGTDGLATEINETQATVATHTKQLNFWRGGLAVLGFLWGAAVAVAAVMFKRH